MRSPQSKTSDRFFCFSEKFTPPYSSYTCDSITEFYVPCNTSVVFSAEFYDSRTINPLDACLLCKYEQDRRAEERGTEQ